MNTEYELKVLEIDIDLIKKKLFELNAIFIKEKFQKRYVYDLIPKNENSWIRLRTDGSKTTLTIKEIQNDSISGTKELEVEVSDFELTNKMLEKLGFRSKGYQENKRISYKLNGVELEIDSWPKIPTYLEIEGKSEEEVITTLKLLKLDNPKITSKSVSNIYLDYGIDLETISILKFE